MDPATLIYRNPRVEYRKLAGEEGAVLLHLDTAAYHGLNEVGALIWDLADGIAFGHLVEELRARFDGVPPGFEDDIVEFVEGMAARDLLVLDLPRAQGGATS